MAVRKRATLTDVARRAGVSVTTASYILNGRSAQMRISSDTDSRVKQASEELDYHPNWSARALRNESTQTIGFVSDLIAGGAFASELLTGANTEARRHKQVLVISETQGDPTAVDRVVEQLQRRQVDSLVMATLAASRVRVPRRLAESRAVLLNCEDPESGLTTVLPDDEGGGRLAAELALRHAPLGRIHVVGEDPSPEATAGPARVRGLVRAMAAAGRTPGETVRCRWDVLDARRATAAWLAGGARPDVLVCLNDRVAFGVYQALAGAGLRVPDDVAVLSFDGSDLGSWLVPTLTSLRLPLVEMGRRAVQLVSGDDWASGRVERLPLAVWGGESLPVR